MEGNSTFTDILAKTFSEYYHLGGAATAWSHSYYSMPMPVPQQEAEGMDSPTWDRVAEVLSQMAEAVSRGWIKGDLYTIHGMCMLGAYMYGTGSLRRRDSREGMAVAGLLEEVIRAEMPAFGTPLHKEWNIVVTFNDMTGTSKGDVLRVIMAARKIAQERAGAGAKIAVQEQAPQSFEGMTAWMQLVAAFLDAEKVPELVAV